jgi:hypothetical protein
MPVGATSYQTNFPKAESLISEGGCWITAGTPGVNWHETLTGGKGDRHVSSVSTTPGYASGPTGPEQFGDALALLTGSWNPNQTASATVVRKSPLGYPEVEIRLRTSPKDATGYEIMWSARGKDEKPYLSIVTWDGPGSKAPHYTWLKQLEGPEYGVTTGDVVTGTIVGNTITAYTNGKLQFQITDNTFSKGNLGFGFNEGPSGTYGISSFSASDVVPEIPRTVGALSSSLSEGIPIARDRVTPSMSLIGNDKSRIPGLVLSMGTAGSTHPASKQTWFSELTPAPMPSGVPTLSLAFILTTGNLPPARVNQGSRATEE